MVFGQKSRSLVCSCFFLFLLFLILPFHLLSLSVSDHLTLPFAKLPQPLQVNAINPKFLFHYRLFFP